MSSYAAPNKSAAPGVYVPRIGEQEKQLVHGICEGFVPTRLFDLHAHLLRGDHFPEANRPAYWQKSDLLAAEAYRRVMGDFFGERDWSGLFFGFPSRGNDVEAINEWMTGQVNALGNKSQALYLCKPDADAEAVTAQLLTRRFAGIKPYHLYAPLPETDQAPVLAFAPEWMWEACHDAEGVLMLHIMKDGGISDPENQAALRRMLKKYPRCHLVLAHIARSFNYRCARGNLRWLNDFGNVWLDTSAITETETFRIALQEMGAGRVAFGTDFPISNLRGKSMTVSGPPRWFYSGDSEYSPNDMTLVGIESLRCLREACEDLSLGEDDLRNIFETNATRVLRRETPADLPSGPELWAKAKSLISCGSGLRSKWAELYDPGTWPSYFSRCKGSRIWDLAGREYMDFGAGAGAIVLGYSDPVVDHAVRQQVGRGTYCTLLSPKEIELAELLLELHPWAGKVRYARGGGDAMGVAVRIARAATNRSGIAFCGYHGWQDWYLAANLGDSASLDGHLMPGLQPLGVPRELKGTSVGFKYNDLASFEAALAALDHRPAAVVMEPMRTQWPEPGFLETIKRRAAEVGAVLIMDEITSGWRFGFPGAGAALEIEPDIAVYAKAMSNGFPCGAIIGRGEIMDAANGSFISSSYWTDGVGPAAALACITRMRDNKVQEAIWQRGGDFQSRLRHVASQHGGGRPEIGGMPCNPYVSFAIGAQANLAKIAFIRLMKEQGILLAGVNYVMYTHTDDMFEHFLAAAAGAFDEVGRLVTEGTLEDYVGENTGIGNFARLT
jgi:glutamate-1-semialdehyde 2,1-aminomutase